MLMFSVDGQESRQYFFSRKSRRLVMTVSQSYLPRLAPFLSCEYLHTISTSFQTSKIGQIVGWSVSHHIIDNRLLIQKKTPQSINPTMLITPHNFRSSHLTPTPSTITTSIPRISRTQMLRALKPPHIRSTDKPLRLPQITTTNRSAPNRPTIMSIILQDKLLIKVIRPSRAPNITDRNRERAFPRHALGTWVAPAFRERGFGAGCGGCGVVGVLGDVVGVEGGVNYVLGAVSD